MKLLVEEKADLQACNTVQLKFSVTCQVVPSPGQARTGNKQQNMALHLAAMNKASRDIKLKIKNVFGILWLSFEQETEDSSKSCDN